jgi:hypothetical protein
MSHFRLITLTLIASACLAQTPITPPVPVYQENEQKVVWVSGPAAPGDSVILTGAFTTTPKHVRIARITGSQVAWRMAVDRSTEVVPAESVESESICFKLPTSGTDGVYAVRIEDDGGARLYARVNLPEIYWTMGLPASQYLARPDAQIVTGGAPQGGTLRLFGRSFGNKPAVLLTSSSGHSTPLQVVEHGRWSLSAILPVALQPGAYNVSVQAEQGRVDTSSTQLGLNVYSYRPATPRTLNVRSCGAKGDGQTDDTRAIQSCLTQAGTHPDATKATYTVVQFPSGRYHITETLTIPQHVYLEGSSEAEVSIIATAPQIPQQWITGQGYFGLSKMNIVAEDPRQVISSSATTSSSSVGHILLDHLAIHANVSPAVAAQPTPTKRVDQQPKGYELLQHKRNTVDLSGPDIRITNTEIRSNGRAFVLADVRGGILVNDGIYNGRYGWYEFGNCESLIFEGSRVSGTDPMTSGGSYSAGPGGLSQNIYTAGNAYNNLPDNNGEAISTDGPNGAFFGKVESASASRLLLASDPNWNGRDWRQASIAILGGHGAGQYRLIRNFDGRKVELDHPFDIPPDVSSVLTIVAAQRHLIFEGNRITDAGVGIQLYGTAYECIIADNILSRSGGIYLHAAKYGGIQPNLFIQVLDNKIIRRGSFKQGLSGQNLNDLGVVQVQCLPPSLSLGIVVRNNALGTEATVRVVNPGNDVHGALIERNQVGNTETGIGVSIATHSVTVHRQ